MATGTLAPVERRQYFDNDGRPLAYGKLYTYAAGTDTPQAIYTDHLLTVPHTQPASLDGSGRITMYLQPGAYKFVLKDAENVTLYVQDFIAATPPTAVDLDVEGTGGVAIAANRAVYLATDGRWYPGDASAPVSSSRALAVGMSLTAIPQGGMGTIRKDGHVGGLTEIVPGATYYIAVGPGGTLTTTKPTNARRIGYGDTDGTSIILQSDHPSPHSAPVTAGLHELFLPALAFQPRVGNPCGNHEQLSTASGFQLIGLPHSNGVLQFAMATVRLPKSWNPALATQFDLWWTNKVGGSGNVNWGVWAKRHEAGTSIDTGAFGTVSSLSAAQAAYVTVTTSASLLIPGGVGSYIVLLVGRTTGAPDTYAQPAYFLGLTLKVTTQADTDD